MTNKKKNINKIPTIFVLVHRWMVLLVNQPRYDEWHANNDLENISNVVYSLIATVIYRLQFKMTYDWRRLLTSSIQTVDQNRAILMYWTCITLIARCILNQSIHTHTGVNLYPCVNPHSAGRTYMCVCRTISCPAGRTYMCVCKLICISHVLNTKLFNWWLIFHVKVNELCSENKNPFS